MAFGITVKVFLAQEKNLEWLKSFHLRECSPEQNILTPTTLGSVGCLSLVR